MPPKRALSAYFVFSSEQREAARAEYLATSGAEKVSVAAVAKLLGEKWRALADEERAHYQKLAADKSAADAELAASQDAQPMDEDRPGDSKENEDQDAKGKGAQPLPFGLPLSLVKRIMLLDKDVSQISTDAVKATAKATELVIEILTARAFKAAITDKRHTIKFSDVEQAVHADKRWEISGVRELLGFDEMFAEARSAGGGDRSKNVQEADPKARSITDFFRADS